MSPKNRGIVIVYEVVYCTLHTARCILHTAQLAQKIAPFRYTTAHCIQHLLSRRHVGAVASHEAGVPGDDVPWGH